MLHGAGVCIQSTFLRRWPVIRLSGFCDYTFKPVKAACNGFMLIVVRPKLLSVDDRPPASLEQLGECVTIRSVIGLPCDYAGRSGLVSQFIQLCGVHGSFRGVL